jgi:hypothetical protein
VFPSRMNGMALVVGFMTSCEACMGEDYERRICDVFLSTGTISDHASLWAILKATSLISRVGKLFLGSSSPADRLSWRSCSWKGEANGVLRRTNKLACILGKRYCGGSLISQVDWRMAEVNSKRRESEQLIKTSGRIGGPAWKE